MGSSRWLVTLLNDYLQELTNNKILLVLIAAFIGAFISTILVSFLRQKEEIRNKILDQYLIVRKEITEVLAKMASKPFNERFTDDEIGTFRNQLSTFFYQYYDFLPRALLRELLCLISCLGDKEHRIYKFQNRRFVPIDLNDDLPIFLESISMSDNFMWQAQMKLHGKASPSRRVAGIVCQTRFVLLNFNKHFSLRQLRRWSRHLPKSASLERTNLRYLKMRFQKIVSTLKNGHKENENPRL